MGEEGWLEGVESSVTVFRNDVKDRISISRTSDVNAAPGYPQSYMRHGRNCSSSQG